MTIRFLALATLFAATNVAALPHSPSQRAEAFATCAGRYAAQDTYWAQQKDSSVERATFDALLDAILPAAVDFGMPESHAANAKFQAWKTHAYLRNDANFAVDALRRNKAAARLARDLADCAALIS